MLETPPFCCQTFCPKVRDIFTKLRNLYLFLACYLIFINGLSSYMDITMFRYAFKLTRITLTFIYKWPWLWWSDYGFSLFLAIIKSNFFIYLWIRFIFGQKPTLVPNLFALSHLSIDLSNTLTKQHIWSNWHVGWFWYDLDWQSQIF